MSDPARKDERTKISCGVVASVAVFILVLLVSVYVLSVGPAVYLIEHGIIDQEPLEFFYLPLIWLAAIFEPFREAINWYAELWTD
jgi:hypothetical protein